MPMILADSTRFTVVQVVGFEVQDAFGVYDLRRTHQHHSAEDDCHSPQLHAIHLRVGTERGTSGAQLLSAPPPI